MPMKKIAAIYARYSTDLQNDKSIDDQVMLCRHIASRNGFKVGEDLIFTDPECSSATLRNRDEWPELMACAKRGDFDVLIVEGLDRISRDQEDTAGVYKRLGFKDIEIYTLEGKVGKVEEIHVGIRNIVGPIFLKDLGNKVRRHHDARAREGIIPGAITYGYRPKPGGRPGEREVDPDEAKVVIRIFEEYVSGKPLRDIAVDLEGDGIKNPSGGDHWNVQSFTHGSGGNGMIGNKIYIGRLLWNAFRTVRNPETGKRVRKRNNPEDVIVTEVPQLRSISDALFNRAQELLKSRAVAMFGKTSQAAGRLAHHEGQPVSGLLICDCCGGHMRMTKSRQTRRVSAGETGPRAACAAANHRNSCPHRKSYDLAMLERTVLDGIKKHLMSPKALVEYTKAYHARCAERQKTGDREAVEREIKNVTTQIDRYVTAIGETDAPPKPIVEKIGKLEAERVGLAEKLKLIEAEGNVVSLHPQAIDGFIANMQQLYDALSGAVTVNPATLTSLRTAFRNAFDRIIVHRTEPRKPYEVTPYLRLSAITGMQLFPKMRSAEEMLAEQRAPIFGPRAANQCRPS
jgi:site-specific DNA recombinase